jgi:ribonuclease HI
MSKAATKTTIKGKLRKKVTIFCDGSSLGNGKVDTRAAAVALLGYQGIWRSVGCYLGQATNQQAEIAAAAVGLEALKQPCEVHIFSDSRYVVETMSGRFRRKITSGGHVSIRLATDMRSFGNGPRDTQVMLFRRLLIGRRVA